MSSEEHSEETLSSTPATSGSLKSLLQPWKRSYQVNWIGGVCGGMAGCTGVSVWVWRALFVLLTAFYGLGLAAYLVLWSAIPGDNEQAQALLPKPMFRKTDWTAFLITVGLSFIGYYLTLAPDLTLEDSGELAVGSMYAGVPHPPGYPVWTLYTWLFTVLIPISNIAWRVALSSAAAAALAAGFIALMVSRGSSMLMEGVEDFKNLDRKRENWICAVTGVVAGMLLAFNGTIWSQAVIVEVYTLSVLSLVVTLVLLFRWLYAPQQRRYLYWAFFVFGICFTNHQTLVVAAMGVEVLIMAVDRKLGRDLFLANGVVYVLVLILKANGKIVSLESNLPMFVIFNVVGIASICVFGWLWSQTGKVLTEWKAVLALGLFWIAGAAFYLYMPLASMTNPPMNWGYPRTWEGFIHAISRGQYEQANPTTGIVRFLNQVRIYYEGARNEFNTVFMLIGLLPFAFYAKMRNREKNWIIGLSAIYVFLAFLLLILLNPTPDRQSRELNRVFFTSSHVIIAMGIGYGLTLIAALIATQYERIRQFLLWGGSAASGIGLYYVIKTMEETDYSFLILAAWLGFLLPVAFTSVVLIRREQARLSWFLILFAIVPLQSICAHWADNEERGHLFGYWFGHDMFDPPFENENGEPLYPDMARDAILFGGTDPGRFNPTYMIFCESFIDPEDRRNPEFDRRDVYLITQNALADGTYLSYIRAHYNRSAQPDPPFFQVMLGGHENLAMGKTNLLARLARPVDNYFLNLGDQIEKERRTFTSWFEADHFIDLASFANKLHSGSQSGPLSAHLFGQLSDKTKSLVEAGGSGGSLAEALAEDLNRVLDAGLLYEPGRFEGVSLTERTRRFIAQNPQSHTQVRLNRLLLEEAYPDELMETKGGVYPDLEIYTPSVADSQQAFGEYMTDAQQRSQLGQLKPGEDVSWDASGHVQVAGQVAVMAINALLTKIIFDNNPNHEFYVEESFPLEWMFPHLTPYGIIMKLNREPVPEFTEDMVARDHSFWKQYSQRLIGDWITYDTPVQEVCDFAARLYIRHVYEGFEGDRKFIRDGNAQKSFSKLRSSAAGLYAWRINNAKSTEEQKRMIREAIFAYKQAYAFCPYSPEALFRFVNLLISLGRLDEALTVAETSLQFDLENVNVLNLFQQLRDLSDQQSVISNSVAQIGELTRQFETNKTNAQLAFNLVAAHLALGNTNAGLKVLDDLAKHPEADANTLLSVAGAYQQLGVGDRLEDVFLRVVRIIPENPEAWYDLAAIQGILGKTNAAIESLRTCVELSDVRLNQDPSAPNLRQQAATDPRFANLRGMPEFRQLFQ